MRGEHVMTRGNAKAVNTGGWVNKKIADGEISGGVASEQSGTSIFDPVLCELVYRWFAPPGGTVLDPFAGGSVRGIVASKLGRKYIGYELRPEQVDANRKQAGKLCDGFVPKWVNADSRTLDAAKIEADFILSCPPYANLEVYSDDDKDLSTLPYPEFLSAYREIIAKACSKLKNDRFACFVVGEVRNKKGGYYNFVGDTVTAFLDAGLTYYNEMILVTAVGSLPIRAARQFESGRKIGKTHQNVLVFLKGSAKKATQAIGAVEFAAPDMVSVKISAKSARLEFVPCSTDFIADVCHGRCCDTPSRPDGCMVTINEIEVGAIEARGGVVVDGLLKPIDGEKGCPFKEDGLCSLHTTNDKPFGCIASPFTLNKNGTLIVRNRYKMLPCYKATDGKAPAYAAHFESLKTIFGIDEATRIADHLKAGGGDLVAQMPKHSHDILLENDAIKKG